MITKKFQRTKEDFICEKCGFKVEGSGYTNHCPRCLWSKHIDVNPGDRQAICQGLMKPVSVILKGGEYIILHRCTQCSLEKRNKAAKADDFDVILQLSAI
ncbi:MAG: RNHCP domain-containing protein [Patescibacteria group bacterium]